jgi:hypothetical protein
MVSPFSRLITLSSIFPLLITYCNVIHFFCDSVTYQGAFSSLHTQSLYTRTAISHTTPLDILQVCHECNAFPYAAWKESCQRWSLPQLFVFLLLPIGLLATIHEFNSHSNMLVSKKHKLLEILYEETTKGNTEPCSVLCMSCTPAFLRTYSHFICSPCCVHTFIIFSRGPTNYWLL